MAKRYSSPVELGSISAKYESKGDPGVIGNIPGDQGDKSYGAWQLASKMGSVDSFLIWLAETDFDYYQMLIEAKEKDGNAIGMNFDKAWQQIAEDDRTGFLLVQHAYIKYAYYDVAAKKLKDTNGFDISTRSTALQNVLWSTAVQHGAGRAVGIFCKVGRSGGDEEIIIRIYNERQKVDIYFKNSSPDVKRSVYNRLKVEKVDALEMLSREKK